VLLFLAFVLTTPQGALQYAFPVLAVIVIYVFSFDQGRISSLLRSRGFQKLGLWSYSIYMVHIFVFQVAKMAVSYIGHKTNLELVGWHNNEKLVLLGAPEQAVWFALIFSIVLVVPVAALTYRWIEKPALDAAKRGVKVRTLGQRIMGRTSAVQTSAASDGEWHPLAESQTSR
jgi:peptidoglycan/LPS O-acetylase OafA/YrhL